MKAPVIADETNTDGNGNSGRQGPGSDRPHMGLLLACLPAMVIAALYLFPNLSDFYLWQDEANAALLSKNILKFGYPYVFDGKNLIWPNPSDVSPSHFFWILWGWLPLYANAAVFSLLDATTLSARIVHAALGWALIPLAGFFIHRLGGNRRVVFWTTLHLALCVPLVLHFRQCGYYAFSVVSAWIMLCAFLLPAENRYRTFLFVAASTALVNTQIMIWGIFWGSLLLLSPLTRRFSTQKMMFLASLAAAVPFLFLYEPWTLLDRTSAASGIKGFLPYGDRFLFYLEAVHQLFFPWWLYGVGLVCFLARRRWFSIQDRRTLAVLFGCLLIAAFTVPLATKFVFLRYVVVYFPLLLWMAVIVADALYRHQRILGSVFFIFLFFYNGFGARADFRGGLFFQTAQFVHELVEKNEDVNEVLCRYLAAHADPSDVVLAPYGDLPIMFYTDLKVRGGPAMIGIRDDNRFRTFGIEPVTAPDWIIARKAWMYLFPPGKFEAFLRGHAYEKIVLPVHDKVWGNRPSSLFHDYGTQEVVRPLEIYRRIDSLRKGPMP